MQQSIEALITSLIGQGHRASLLCSLMPNGMIGKLGRLKIKLSKSKLAKDNQRGYAVYRSWFPWETVEAVIKRERPDVMIVSAHMPVKMALAARKTGIPVMMMLQDVEFDAHGGDFAQLGTIECAANSAFTAGRYHDAYGVTPHVIHPLIFPEKYRTMSTRDVVTYINPNPEKGLDIALAVAKACPDIPFLFQESWPLTPKQLEELQAMIADLPNVTLQRAVSDMRDVYNRTKILLVPSKWEEAYGRVASEVQISGIPVIASNIGGLPEAVGKGGILLDPRGDITPWIEAVQKMWTDDTYYQSMVTHSLDHANRPALNIANQLATWEKILSGVVLSHKRNAPN